MERQISALKGLIYAIGCGQPLAQGGLRDFSDM